MWRLVTVVASQLQVFRNITSSQRSQTCCRLQNLQCRLGTFQPPNQGAWDSALYGWFKAPARKLQYGTKKDCFNLVYLCKSAPDTIKSFFFYPKWPLWLHLLLYRAHGSHQMDGIRSLQHLLESKVWLTPFAGLESGNWTSPACFPINRHHLSKQQTLPETMPTKDCDLLHCLEPYAKDTRQPPIVLLPGSWPRLGQSSPTNLLERYFEPMCSRGPLPVAIQTSWLLHQSMPRGVIRMKSKMENKSESQVIRLSR